MKVIWRCILLAAIGAAIPPAAPAQTEADSSKKAQSAEGGHDGGFSQEVAMEMKISLAANVELADKIRRDFGRSLFSVKNLKFHV